MHSVQRNAFKIMDGLRHDVERQFRAPQMPGAVPLERYWKPAIDIREESERFLIQADVPGVDAGDLSVTFVDSVLTVAGKRAAVGADQDTYHRFERATGAFRRRFKLPESADSEALEASYRDGVLTISVPKRKQAEPRHVRVN